MDNPPNPDAAAIARYLNEIANDGYVGGGRRGATLPDHPIKVAGDLESPERR